MNSYNFYTRTPGCNRAYLTETDQYPEKFENYTKYKIKLSTCTGSHANKNKHKNDNWFSECSRQ